MKLLMPSPPAMLRPRQRLGKYRIVRRIAFGGFADVFEAEDTVEGVRVALRAPRADIVNEEDVVGTMMTDKAAVELSSPVTGKVVKLLISVQPAGKEIAVAGKNLGENLFRSSDHHQHVFDLLTIVLVNRFIEPARWQAISAVSML